MQGKTTFILTDRDTGRVVDKREEKNMVTDFIKDVFVMPKFALIGGNINNGLAKMLPMYDYLLHGLILFDCNIPEKRDDYIINGRYNMLATAGEVYSGTDTQRGTFNQNLSGEIENGYRFVWDFAPERAVGTIRCAALSSLQTGNQGGTFSAGGVIANALDLSNSSSAKAGGVTGSMSSNYMMYRNKYYYYYSTSTSDKSVTISKYSMADPDSIRINSTRSLKLEETYKLTIPYTPNNTFPNVYEGRFYVSQIAYSSGRLEVNTGYIDLDTKEFTRITPTAIETPVTTSNYSPGKCAVFNNQIYFGYNSNIYVFEFDGMLVKTIPLKTTSLTAFFLKDNKLHVSGAISNAYCIIILGGDEPVYLPNYSSFAGYEVTDHEDIKCPYIGERYLSSLYIMLRADYLATINNLAEPLEKTDRHALQVRYEITDS